jgi:hypothetical protein
VAASSLILQKGRCGLNTRSGLFVVRGTDVNARTTGIALELGLTPGLYGDKGHLGLNLAVTTTLASHFSFREYPRSAFGDRYPHTRGQGPQDGPKDGWAGWTNVVYQAGLSGSRSLGTRFSLAGQLSFTTLAQQQGMLMYDALGYLPLRAEATVGYHFQ